MQSIASLMLLNLLPTAALPTRRMFGVTLQREQRPAVRYQRIYEIYSDEVPVEPLKTRHRLAVVVLRDEATAQLEPFFVVSNFRTRVLGDSESSLYVSDETFSRTLKMLAIPHVYCDSKKEHTELLQRLKARQVLGSNCSKAKLASLHGLQTALLHLRLRPTVVGQLVKMMFSLVPPTVPIGRPGELAAVNTNRPLSDAAAAATSAAATAGIQQLISNLLVAPVAMFAPTASDPPAASVGAAAAADGVANSSGAVAPAAAAAAPAVAPAVSSCAAAAGPVDAEPPAATVAAKKPRLLDSISSGSTAARAWAASVLAALVPQQSPAPVRTMASSYESRVSSEPLPQRLPNRCYSPQQLYDDYGITVHIPDW